MRLFGALLVLEPQWLEAVVSVLVSDKVSLAARAGLICKVVKEDFEL